MKFTQYDNEAKSPKPEKVGLLKFLVKDELAWNYY